MMHETLKTFGNLMKFYNSAKNIKKKITCQTWSSFDWTLIKIYYYAHIESMPDYPS